jgi:hypothetical protein
MLMIMKPQRNLQRDCWRLLGQALDGPGEASLTLVALLHRPGSGIQCERSKLPQY